MIEALGISVGFEALVDATSAGVGLSVLLFARRLVSRLSLFLHRRALRIFLLGAAFFVLSELIAALDALVGGAGTFFVIVEDVAELSMLVCLGLAAYAVYGSEREEISILRRSANTDELTNLPNRSFFNRAAERRLELSRENNLPEACAVLDIDDFKAYNDDFGHEAGDNALRCVSRALERATRADDLLARYGGEEVVLMMNGTLEVAAVVTERIRKEVEEHCSPASDPGMRRGITVSLGVAALTAETETLEGLIAVADGEMYGAKRAGKNRMRAGGFGQEP